MLSKLNKISKAKFIIKTDNIATASIDGYKVYAAIYGGKCQLRCVTITTAFSSDLNALWNTFQKEFKQLVEADNAVVNKVAKWTGESFQRSEDHKRRWDSENFSVIIDTSHIHISSIPLGLFGTGYTVEDARSAALDYKKRKEDEARLTLARLQKVKI